VTIPDAIVQAAIAGGSAVLGGLVGGWLTVRAAREQWRHDAQAANMERSHFASQRLLIATAQPEAALVTWRANHDVELLKAAFNSFSATSMAGVPFVPYGAVATRVRAHNEFGFRFVSFVTSRGGAAAPLVESFRRHADAVTDTLEAHIQGRRLPTYPCRYRTLPPSLRGQAILPTPVQSGRVEEASGLRQKLLSAWLATF
jgi:hypothetical protein